MFTAVASGIAAVALWTSWAVAALMMTAIAGSIFYWLLTDDDNPGVITITDHSNNTAGRERVGAASFGHTVMRRRMATKGMV